MRQMMMRFVLFGGMAVAPLTAAVAAETIHVIHPQSWQVFQRNGGRADIPIKLSVDGPTDVYAAVSKGGEVIVKSRSIGKTEKAGEVCFILKEVPEGGWYDLELKAGSEVRVIKNIGVGIVIGVIGQSNASGYGGLTHKETVPLSSVCRACGVFEPLKDPVCRPEPQFPLPEALQDDPAIKPFLAPTEEFKRKNGYLDWGCTGSCWPEFAALMANHFHVPIMIIPGAKGSSVSDFWLPTCKNPPLFDSMLRYVRKANTSLAAIIVNQGESDCDKGEKGYDSWIGNTGVYVDAFRRELADPGLPFLFVQIRTFGKWTPLLRKAIEDFCEKKAGCHMAALTYDIGGGVHYDMNGALPTRLFNAYRNIIEKDSSVEYIGPKAVALRYVPANNQMIVEFDKPVTGLEGQYSTANIEVLTDADKVDISSAAACLATYSTTVADLLQKHSKDRLKSARGEGNRMIIELKEALPKEARKIVVRYAISHETKTYPGAILRGSGAQALPAGQFMLEAPI